MSQTKKQNNKRNKKHNNKGYRRIAFVIVLILLFLVVIKNKPIKNNYTNIQVILNNENITEKIESPIIIENEQIYMGYNDIKNFLDESLYTENETNLIITASDKKVAAINPQNQTLEINSSNIEVKNIYLERDCKKYIAISELKNVYNYEITNIKKTNIITIDSLNKKSTKAYAKKNLKVKKENNALSANIDVIKKGSWLYFIKEENDYAKIRTQNGVLGYVKKKSLANFVNERDDFIEEVKEFSKENALKQDISNEDLTTFEKRKKIINIILQEAIKNGNMYVQIIYTGESNFEYERFKIEVIPVLRECGITVKT